MIKMAIRVIAMNIFYPINLRLLLNLNFSFAVHFCRLHRDSDNTEAKEISSMYLSISLLKVAEHIGNYRRSHIWNLKAFSSKSTVKFVVFPWLEIELSFICSLFPRKEILFVDGISGRIHIKIKFISEAHSGLQQRRGPRKFFIDHNVQNVDRMSGETPIEELFALYKYI